MNEMMRREIETQANLLPKLQPTLAELADTLPRMAGRIYAGGCGDSAFAPQALQDVFRSLGVEIISKTSMELSSYTRFQPSDTVLLSSISGGTKRTVEAANAARERGADVVAITCNGESALAQAATSTLEMPFKPLSRKTPHTLDYAVTLLATAEIARSHGGFEASTLASALSDLDKVLAAAEERANQIAEDHSPEGKVIFLGSDCDLGTANYAAAKLHEAGGLTSFAAETENFVHGMNFMLEPQDMLAILASTEAGIRRGQTVADAFSPLCATHILENEKSIPKPANALSLLLGTTFTVQFLCLKIADKMGLHLEEPRAGRPRGSQHAAAQSAAMGF
ncbi:SIS domain-containing protein [Nitratireductor sp. CH_MIT9313-5]|uniref:SIS domain-containing protein n=1 Tax=Nitratireductor sp. CH_MIT9313-5 TaxID=3107764 RepID=UPI003009E421